MSPMFAGNLFSVAFGRNLDAHERDSSSAPSHHRFSSPAAWAAANDTVASVARAPSLGALTRVSLEQIRAQTQGAVALAAPGCSEGRLCYVDTLYITAAACALALGLSVWAGWRDKRKLSVAAEQQKERERRVGG